MISSVETVDASKTPVEWWGKFARLQRKVSFSPTLNILVGPNGSGKSTMILALARMFHCAQGEVPTVTSASMEQFPDSLGLKILHDGQLVFCMRTEESPGLIGGMAGFDDDFMTLGVSAMMNQRYSHGQQTLIRTPAFLEMIVKVKGIDWRIDKKSTYAPLAKKVAAIEKFLTTPTARDWKRGTVLLDEPEDGLSLPMQVQTWKLINMVSMRFQVIVATQSPLAYAQRDAHFIEMEDGFVESCKKTILDQYGPLFDSGGGKK
jgi:predicted ATPase